MATRPQYPSDVADKFLLRLPDGLRERIKASAEEHGRSMNAEIIFMLQRYFDNLGDEALRLGEALEAEQRQSISLGLKDPADRTAVLKVLLISELTMLRRRVDDLGGRDAVLAASKGDLVKNITGPKLEGTEEEQQSYFSRIVGETPLTAVLSTEEIDKLASRVVALRGQQEVLNKKS